MRVAIYARVSSDRQDIDLAISAQLKALTGIPQMPYLWSMSYPQVKIHTIAQCNKICYNSCMRKLSKEQVDSVRMFREAGAPIEDLSRIYSLSRVTIWRHTRDIKPAPDGHLIELVEKATLSEWLPLLPWEGLPLPRWLARSLPVRWGQVKALLEEAEANGRAQIRTNEEEHQK